MEKAIFSITCTTCQARLAVRSEAAIGQILECPKCRSMVQVAPPPGWTPAAPPVLVPRSTEPSGPPPLDRVAVADSPMLELEPAAPWQWQAIFRQMWFLWGAALVVVSLVVWGLWTALMPPPSPETNKRVESGARKEERKDAAAKDGDKEKQPTPEVADVADDANKPAPPLPETPPDDIEPTPTPPAPPEASSTPSDPPPESAPPPPEPDVSLDEKLAEEKEAAKPDAKPPAIKRLPPPHVDVAARMADPLAGIEIAEISLADAMNLLSVMSTTPITLDADALARLGASPRDPISLRLGSTTVGQALKAVAAERGLVAKVEGAGVVITAPAASGEELKTVRYTVSDLTGDGKADIEDFAALVQKMVVPDSWQAAGGQGTIEAAPSGVLIVAQTGEVHDRLVVFCEKLRGARKIPLRSGGNPERFALTTRLETARKMLDRPISANFHEPTPLVKIVAFLARASGGDILIDRAALAAAETSDGVQASMTANKQPLGEILDELLPPLGLAYRVVAPGLLQVTSKEAAEERPELEFYPVKKVLAGENSAEKLVERLKAEVAPAAWSDAGGVGEAYYDSASQYLIVLQSQPVQAAVARWLSPKKNEK